jgi:hypothetical protein
VSISKLSDLAVFRKHCDSSRRHAKLNFAPESSYLLSGAKLMIFGVLVNRATYNPVGMADGVLAGGIERAGYWADC